MMVTLSGCSGAGSSASDSDPSRPGAVINVPMQKLNDSKELRLPLDEYLLSAEDLRTVLRARGVILTDCMKKLGVQYDDAAGVNPVNLTNNERRYGLADAAEAEHSGYRKQGMEHPPPKDLSPEELQLLNGTGDASRSAQVPKGGCVGEVQRRMPEQAAQGYFGKAQDLSVRSYVQSQKDPAVLAVNKKWSSCMKEAGYEYPDPISAINDPAFKTPEPGKVEMGVALADVRCKREENVIGVWSTVESAYQKALISESADDLKEAKRYKGEIIKIAEAVLSGKQ